MENTVMTVIDSDNNEYEVYVKTGPKDSFQPLNINYEDIPLNIRQTNHPDGLIFLIKTENDDSVLITKIVRNNGQEFRYYFTKKDIILVFKGGSE